MGRWAETNLLSLWAERISGKANTMADWLSRTNLNQSEWVLHLHLFWSLVRCFSQPTVDLFASRDNRKVPRFFTNYKTPGVEGVDALRFRWPKGLLYAFPPSHSFSGSFRRC